MIEYADPRKIPPPYSRSRRFVAGGFSMIGWIILAIAILVIFGFVMAVSLAPMLGWTAGVGLAVLLIISAQCLRAARRRRAILLVSYLEQGVRLNLPLPQMLASAARGETRAVRKRLERLRTAIEDGAPIGEAIEFAAPETPQRIVQLTLAAERNGRLPQALARLICDEQRAGRRDPAGAAFQRAYVVVLVCAIAMVISLLTIFVVPKFSQIMRDFQTPAPPITRIVADAASVLALPFGLIAFLILVWMSGRALRDTFIARPLSGGFRNLLDRGIWYTPLAGGLARDRGLADACHVIADGLAVGRPLEQAIAEADRPHLNAVLRERLSRWCDALVAGAQGDAAARAASMPNLICGLLATSQRSGDTLGVFQFLARHYDSRFSRAALLAQSAVVPGIALSAGAIVCATVLAVFIPLIRMIDVLAPMVRP